MSAPRPLESVKLARAEAIITSFTSNFPRQQLEARLQLLEAASSRFGGFSLAAFQNVFGVRPICDGALVSQIAEDLVTAICASEIPPALALSALCRESLNEAERRKTGAYHTDFRLALHLAEIGVQGRGIDFSVADPACGTGMLLAAVVYHACGANRQRSANFLRWRVHAADLSQSSLRGALISLASFTADIEALRTMRRRWLVQDSLLSGERVWQELAPIGFDLVIGNPPWEKIKTTRHEFLKLTGTSRHYGAEYSGLEQDKYEIEQMASIKYAATLSGKYVAARGEVDLYTAFLELFINITATGGRTAALVPAGLIRSQRTEHLRRLVFGSSTGISVSVIDNHARFFEIDTRFKFLALRLDKRSARIDRRTGPLVISHAIGTSTGLKESSRATIGRSALAAIRPDLTIPEVRTNREWALFLKLSHNGISWFDANQHWTPEIVREVDMTRDRRLFHKSSQPGLVPLIEGRMVHHHRLGAKTYVSGSGRSAIWRPAPLGSSRIVPQFWIDRQQLSHKVRLRADVLRAGFCDITGQTNERSMMASLIPAGVVCGNKVPTLTFPEDPSEERLLLWIGIANSFPFDWFLRRIVTTTINYFLLLSIRLPPIAKDSLRGRKIINAVKRLSELDAMRGTGAIEAEAAELRSQIDVEVARGYGLGFDDMALILEDFPLLDRGQPALNFEKRSTITRDFLLFAMAKRCGLRPSGLILRLSEAAKRGAVPYVPEEYGLSPQKARASHA